MANKWEMTLEGHDALLVRMEKYSSKSEELINNVLKSKGTDIAIDNITKLISVSKEELRKGHRHAQSSRPLQPKMINLGFIIRPKKAFEYIKYPDLGIGTSKSNEPIEFMKRGLEMSLEPIADELVQAFDKIE